VTEAIFDELDILLGATGRRDDAVIASTSKDLCRRSSASAFAQHWLSSRSNTFEVDQSSGFGLMPMPPFFALAAVGDRL